MSANCESDKCQDAFQKRIENHKLLFQPLFWSKVQVGDMSDCWLWQSTLSGKRYGNVTIDSKPQLAHRVAYRLIFGDIPEGMMVCHHCDNPPCCNPLHLFLGTGSDNQIDCVNKGRKPSVAGENNPIYGLKGERNPKAKFTQAQAEKIREQYKAGLSQKALGKIYGVTQVCISTIVTNKVYRSQAV